MVRQQVRDMPAGSLFQCVPLRIGYLNNTVEVFPHGDQKDVINVTFLSVCQNKLCKKCISSKQDNYTFFETAEYGHMMTMSVWEYDNFISSKDPR